MEICISISASTPAEYRDALNALNAGIQAPAVPAKPSPAPQAAPVQAHVPTDGEKFPLPSRRPHSSPLWPPRKQPPPSR